MTWIAVGIAGAGLLMSYTGQRAAGRAEARRGQALATVGEFEALQLEQNAQTEVATSQRVAGEERRRANLMESRALALASASGGGASDPTVMRLIGDIQAEGAYRSAVALYEGEEQARQLRLGAAVRRYEGQAGLQGGLAAQKAFNISGAASLLTGAGKIAMNQLPTLMEKYGGDTTTPKETAGGTNADAGITGLGDYA